MENFLEEAMQLELNAAEIYAIFSETIAEDADLWTNRSWEERNHASLFKTAEDVFEPLDNEDACRIKIHICLPNVKRTNMVRKLY